MHPLKGARVWSLVVCVCCLVTHLCPTLCDAMDRSLPGSSVHGDSPGKNTGVGCHDLFQGIFPTQGSNPGFPHGRCIFYRLSYQGNPVGETKPCMLCGQKKKKRIKAMTTKTMRHWHKNRHRLIRMILDKSPKTIIGGMKVHACSVVSSSLWLHWTPKGRVQLFV